MLSSQLKGFADPHMTSTKGMRQGRACSYAVGQDVWYRQRDGSVLPTKVSLAAKETLHLSAEAAHLASCVRQMPYKELCSVEPATHQHAFCCQCNCMFTVLRNTSA